MDELSEEFLDAFIGGIYWNVEHGEYPKARRKILALIEQQTQTKGRNMVPENRDPTELDPNAPECESEATEPQAQDGTPPEPGPHTAEVPPEDSVPGDKEDKPCEDPGCACQPEQ